MILFFGRFDITWRDYWQVFFDNGLKLYEIKKHELSVPIQKANRTQNACRIRIENESNFDIRHPLFDILLSY